MRKTKKVVKPKAKVHTKAELVTHIQHMRTELEAAKDMINAMRNEITQLSQMHRTQLQIIDNLSIQTRNNR